MRLFPTIQKNLLSLGLTPDQSSQKHPFNGKVIAGFLIIDTTITSCIMFLLYEADILVEYAECLYIITVLIVILIDFLILFFQKNELFQEIDTIRKNIFRKNDFNHCKEYQNSV